MPLLGVALSRCWYGSGPGLHPAPACTSPLSGPERGIERTEPPDTSGGSVVRGPCAFVHQTTRSDREPRRSLTESITLYWMTCAFGYRCFQNSSIRMLASVTVVRASKRTLMALRPAFTGWVRMRIFFLRGMRVWGIGMYVWTWVLGPLRVRMIGSSIVLRRGSGPLALQNRASSSRHSEHLAVSDFTCSWLSGGREDRGRRCTGWGRTAPFNAELRWR